MGRIGDGVTPVSLARLAYEGRPRPGDLERLSHSRMFAGRSRPVPTTPKHHAKQPPP